ncbi:hypothetical protein P3T76_012599 [Phytophthora citrophthora]|uniref:PX domain-containing protein n=1 Tax=Phytophthora citrophthora TaxID=4793 RepID=A0AAD9G4R4_9STRA|nr:hypothetical protein P3T76_012599 [Phytophthora citrophthora]
MPSNYYLDVASIATDTDTESINTNSGFAKDLQLSQLMRTKVAVKLNRIHHVQMSGAYDEDEHVVVYILNVYLQSIPRGIATLPTKTNTSIGDRRPDYQVEHRYSTFRTLRENVSEAVKVPKDKSHSKWCPYCSRVRELVRSRVFPPRFPSIIGFHDSMVRNREQRLGAFVNLLAQAAKDISYRSGCTPCSRFEVVSQLITEFLAEKQVQTPHEKLKRN